MDMSSFRLYMILRKLNEKLTLFARLGNQLMTKRVTRFVKWFLNIELGILMSFFFFFKAE